MPAYKTTWGYSFTVPYPIRLHVAAGPNWDIFQRTDPTIIAFAFDGEKTLSRVGRNEEEQALKDWAIETAFVPGVTPPPPPPLEEMGSIRVLSHPTAANILLDGVLTGKTTTAVITTTAGLHTIGLTKPGYEHFTAPVVILPAQSFQRTYTMQPIEKPPVAPPPPPPLPPPPKVPRNIAEAIALWLTGDVPQWVLAWGDLVDWLADTFGMEIPTVERDKITGEIKLLPEGKRVLVFFSMSAPITAVEKAVHGAVAKGTVTAIRAQAKAAPTKLAADYAKLTAAQKLAVHDSLMKAGPAGEIASDAIFAITGPGLEKAGLTALPKAAKPVAKIVLAVAGLVGLKEFISWAHKELPEILAFPLRDLVTREKWKEAAVVYPTYERLVAVATTFLRATGFEDFLGMPLWQAYADGMDAQAATWKKQIAEGLAAEEPETTISVTTNVDPALANIPAVFIEKVTPFTANIAPGRYDLTVEKEGYAPKVLTVIIKEKQDNPVSVTLKPVPPEITPRAGRLEMAVYDKKTATPILASFYINDRLEKATAHALALDLVPAAYEIRFEAAGYKIWEDTVVVDENVTTKINAQMEKIPPPPIEPPPEEIPPEEIPPKVPEKGRLEVNCNVEAEILIGGQETAKKTPASFELTQGIYSVGLQAEGYVSRATTTLVKAGEPTTVFLELREEAAPPIKILLARVSIQSDPVGAKILVNGVFTGKFTPDSVLLEAGDYEIFLAKSGYKTWSTPLRLTEES